MITIAVILGLLFGGLRAVKGFVDLQDPEKVEKSFKETELEQQNYDIAKMQLASQIAEYNRQIDDYQKFQDYSLYMRIDPYAVYKESITYMVTTDYQILPDMTYQSLNWMGPVLSAYTTIASSITLKDLPPEGRAGLSEEWDADSLEKLVIVVSNVNDGRLTITASADSEARAKAILQAVREKVEANQENVAEAVGEHKLTQISEKSTITVDQDMINDRETRLRNVTVLREAADKAIEKYERLSEPKNKALSIINIIKAAVKFAVAGVICGAFLSACWFGMKYMVDGILHDPGCLEQKYQSRILGEISEEGKAGPNNSITDAGNEGKQSSEEVLLRTVAASLDSCKAGKVLLISTAECLNLDKFGSLLGKYCSEVEVATGGNLLKDPEVIEKLKKADSVLIVEKKDVSRVKEIDREIQVVQQLGKRTEGFFLY